jgi:hypothetical protein
MARCPFAQWRPLARTQPPAMLRHDLVIAHTMGGNSLSGTDKGFALDGYVGTESHFGIGYDGTIYQWTDTDHMADANVDANDRALSIETADAGAGFATWSGSNVPAWTDAQIDALVRLITWCCDTHDIPKVMIPDSGASRRGIGAHRQGINSSPAGQPGYRKPGTETWSLALGKVCPGDRRFEQLKATVVPAVATGDEVTPAEMAQIIGAIQDNGIRATTQSSRIDPATGKRSLAMVQAGTYLTVIDDNLADLAARLTPASISEVVVPAVVAAIPIGEGGLTAEQIQTAVEAGVRAVFAQLGS